MDTSESYRETLPAFRLLPGPGRATAGAVAQARPAWQFFSKPPPRSGFAEKFVARLASFSSRQRRLPGQLGLCILLLIGGHGSVAVARELPETVTSALRTAQIPADHLGVFVQAVDARQPLLQHQASTPMNPASTMKLVTTYAALDLLGPTYNWRTEARALLSPATPAAGKTAAKGKAERSPLPARRKYTTHATRTTARSAGEHPSRIGDLYLVGGGDPALNQEQFWMLLRQLRMHGLRDIDGDVILDRSRFALPAHDPGAFDKDPLRTYNSGPDALLINQASLTLTLTPLPGARQVRISTTTPAADLHIDNQLKVTSFEDCGDWREKLQVTVLDGQNIRLTGRLPLPCGDRMLYLAPWSADIQVDKLFRAIWQELGGRFKGKVRAGTTPEHAETLAGIDSPPLGSVVRDINKWSNNVMARQLLLALAPETPATLPAARQRLADWLQSKQITGVHVDNGSGLSRHARLSAEALGLLLIDAWRSPVMPELIASLPIAGADGTLKKRFTDKAIDAHLKTGTLDNATALAGYVTDRKGRRWVVVGLINDRNAQNGRGVLNALIEWVAAQR